GSRPRRGGNPIVILVPTLGVRASRDSGLLGKCFPRFSGLSGPLRTRKPTEIPGNPWERIMRHPHARRGNALPRRSASRAHPIMLLLLLSERPWEGSEWLFSQTVVVFSSVP